jgi:hypothetical protein
MENIPNDEVQWEEEKLYCGRCGSELNPDAEDRDLLDEISSGKRGRVYTLEDDDEDEDDEDDDFEDEDEDGDFEDEDDEEEEDVEEEEESNGDGRASRRKRR